GCGGDRRRGDPCAGRNGTGRVPDRGGRRLRRRGCRGRGDHTGSWRGRTHDDHHVTCEYAEGGTSVSGSGGLNRGSMSWDLFTSAEAERERRPAPREGGRFAEPLARFASLRAARVRP